MVPLHDDPPLAVPAISSSIDKQLLRSVPVVESVSDLENSV